MDSLICRQSEIDPVPFDLYCSTSSNVMKRYCKLCGIYFVNMAAYQRHKKAKICLNASDDGEEQQDIPDCENEFFHSLTWQSSAILFYICCFFVLYFDLKFSLIITSV